MDLRLGRSRIPEHLLRVDMSQSEYAYEINVSDGFVSKVISGKKKLSLIKAKMSAKLFKCSIDDLYYWEILCRVDGHLQWKLLNDEDSSE